MDCQKSEWLNDWLVHSSSSSDCTITSKPVSQAGSLSRSRILQLETFFPWTLFLISIIFLPTFRLRHQLPYIQWWVMGDGSSAMDISFPPLTPTATSIHEISGSLQASYQCVIRHQVTFICPTTKDYVMSIDFLSQFPSIVTTFISVDNTIRVTFGATMLIVTMASDLLDYISL